MLKQISVFVENRPGRMTDVLRVLAEHTIDINGLSVADSADFGVLRMILSDPEMGVQVLKSNGFIVKITEVLAIDIDDTPGALYNALAVLREKELNVEYMYAFGTKLSGHAMIIVKTNDNRTAQELLNAAHVTILTPEMVTLRLTTRA